ncbi:hypothetical protein DL769_011135 [Monosporascus sp. CRB-8-3]|nr:hypothetical protein DL769_011135 [Monosporascus sp. CRB-8-3]
MSLHRSATRRRAGGAEQKKGYEVVRQGIKQLYPEEGSNRTTDMDIVFVPGLGADPERSWRSTKTGFNWASDKEGIARDFPNARVLLYMYESAWTGQLKALGATKPIVFIGHSMGGLVIAKAICIAESRPHEFSHMFEDIAGCAFFGTPFSGAEAASRAAMLAHLGENFDRAVPSKLLDLMSPGDEGLKELRDEFVRVATKLNPKIGLYGFWEEQPTKITDLSGVPEFIKKFQIPIPKKIAEFVTRDSAILGGNMEAMGLAANHRDLVKFDSAKDERYALVRGSLKRIVHAAHLVVKSRRLSTKRIDRDLVKKAMETLDGARVSRKREIIAETTAPSSWIPNEAQYVSWLAKFDDSPESSFRRRGDCLWIRGPYGRGKTSATLAALEEIGHMIETNPNTAPVLLAYFFCDNTADYETAEELLKSLVLQLIIQQEGLANHAKFLLRKKRKEDSKSQPQLTVENLWQVLQDILADEDLAGTRVYFVVNNLEALREDSDSTSTFLNLLNVEIENMNSGRRSIVRWMITSAYSIGQELHKGSVRVIDLEDEKYGDQVQRELRKHAYKKVSDLVNRRKYNKALAYYAGSLIGRRAQNTQWIDITIVQLEQLSQGNDDLRVRLHLEIVPQQLDDLLAEAWRRIFELHSADVIEIKEMLRVLVLTNEDPTKEELRLLSGLYSTPQERAELDDLVDKCSPLLRLSEEDIKLQHGMLAFRAFSHIMEKFDFPPIEPKSDGGGNNENSDQEDQDGNETKEEDQGGENEDEDDNEDDNEDDEDDGDDDEDDEDDDDESDTDSALSWESDDEYADPEAKSLENLALPYAVKHWLSHASKATTEIAEALSSEEDFWMKDSIIRRRWLTEHTRLDGAFKYFDRWDLTGLHVAGAIGFRQLIVALMKNGHEDEINLRDALDNTPLHFAAYFGRVDLAEELLNQGASIDDGSENCVETPLCMAASEGRVKVMAKLLQRGADPNAISDTYGGVINAAIDSGNCEAVELLVEKHVSLASRENDVIKRLESLEVQSENDEAEGDAANDGNNAEQEEAIWSPLALAALRSDLTMFNFLIERYSDKLPAEEFDMALVKAAEYGRLEAFKRLFRDYQHPHQVLQDSHDRAANEENWDIVQLLLEECPGLDCDTAFFNTCLGDDSQQKTQVLETIWEYTHGSISTETVNDSLYHATDLELAETVSLLLRFGANPDATGREYGNALTAAAYDGNIHIVNNLLNYNADVNSPDGWALQTAAAKGHTEIVDLLLNHGADVNAYTTHDGMPQGTALQAAVEAGNGEIVDLLLEHEADPNLGGGELTCPIIAAAKKGEKDILERLINAKADVDVFGGPHMSSPLTYAAMSLPQSSIRSLLDAGANINLADNDGDTALILASWVGEAEIVQCLLDRGADVLHRDNAGKNALQRALEGEKPECVNILVAHVSEIMEALRVAVESGDAAVTAVIRSVESRKEGLEYDELSVSADRDIRGSRRSSTFQDEETQDNRPVEETPNLNLGAPRFGEEPQAVVGIPHYDPGPTNPPQDDRNNWRDATGPSAWQSFDPGNVTRPNNFAVSRDEPQRLNSQPPPSWTQDAATPPQRNEYQTPPQSSGPIRRKPITAPDAYGNVPPAVSGPQFVNQQMSQPMQQTPSPVPQRIQQQMATPVQQMIPPYQTTSSHRPQPLHQTSGQTPHSSPPGGTQWNQYRAYQPHQQQQQRQQQRAASYEDNRVSFQQQPYQQSTQSPPQPRPYPPPGMQAGFQRSSPGTPTGQQSQRPQQQPSRPSFLGIKAVWPGDRQI